METRLFTIIEAARYLSVGTTTIKGLVSSGALRMVKVGRCARYDRNDLDALIDARRSA